MLATVPPLTPSASADSLNYCGYKENTRTYTNCSYLSSVALIYNGRVCYTVPPKGWQTGLPFRPPIIRTGHC